MPRYQYKVTVLFHLKLKVFSLKWSFLRYVPPYSNISNKCPLCLYEKLQIVTYKNQKEVLNKRSELLCKCRHANKFLLKTYTGNDFRKLAILSSRKKLIAYAFYIEHYLVAIHYLRKLYHTPFRYN